MRQFPMHLLLPILCWFSTLICSLFSNQLNTRFINKIDQFVNQPSQWTWPCRKRHFPNQSSFVCVCDANYCDQPEPVNLADSNTLVYYLSDPVSHRLTRQTVEFREKRDEKIVPLRLRENIFEIEILVDSSKSFQSIFGFGGAFTDASGINLNKLTAGAQQNLLNAYFHQEKGIKYTVGRVPIASCDFSTREYSYLDTEGDFTLKSFALATEDLKYKIPYLLAANNLSEGALRLFASPWSAPGWMKTNGRMKGGGKLKGAFNGQYYQTYAQYFRRFFEEYSKLGVNFWGVTIQNEPSTGTDSDYTFQTMFLSSQMQRDFAHHLLVPALKQSSSSRNLKVMAHDDFRHGVYDAAKEIYSNATVSESIDGMAIHWYDHSAFDMVTKAHFVRPDKFILATEACTGWRPKEHIPLLGDWNRGMEYGHDIMSNMRNWVVGWTDWNLCLDLQGGPNWVNNTVDSPIIVNATSDEFYKQPMFYFLAHFSRFIPPGSIRIDSTISKGYAPLIEHVAFKTSDGNRAMVIINANPTEIVKVTIRDAKKKSALSGRENIANFKLPPNSIVTAIWLK